MSAVSGGGEKAVVGELAPPFVGGDEQSLCGPGIGEAIELVESLGGELGLGSVWWCW